MVCKEILKYIILFNLILMLNNNLDIISMMNKIIILLINKIILIVLHLKKIYKKKKKY